VLKKMQSSGGKAVSVSRQEIAEFLISDRSPIVLQTLEEAIRERAVDQEAKKRGIVVTPDELQARFTEVVNGVRQQSRLSNMTDKQVLQTLGFRTGPAMRQL